MLSIQWTSILSYRMIRSRSRFWKPIYAENQRCTADLTANCICLLRQRKKKKNLHTENCLPVVRRMLISCRKETTREAATPVTFNLLIEFKIILCHSQTLTHLLFTISVYLLLLKWEHDRHHHLDILQVFGWHYLWHTRVTRLDLVYYFGIWEKFKGFTYALTSKIILIIMREPMLEFC